MGGDCGGVTFLGVVWYNRGLSTGELCEFC